MHDPTLQDDIGHPEMEQGVYCMHQTGVHKVELVLRDCQARLAGIIVYSSICCQTTPPTEHILKLQIKAAACKTILGYTSFLIVGRLPLMDRWAAFDVCAIYGTKSTSKKRAEIHIRCRMVQRRVQKGLLRNT